LETVRNPVSIALVYQPFGKLWWYYTPEFRVKGPFYTKDEAEKALESYISTKESLNEC
jgi:hypothetical protein